MVKTYISIFLLLCVVVFMIPSTQIGFVLYQNLLTEEHSLNNMENDDTSNVEYISMNLNTVMDGSNTNRSYSFPQHYNLFSRFSDDIQTPPPNT